MARERRLATNAADLLKARRDRPLDDDPTSLRSVPDDDASAPDGDPGELDLLDQVAPPPTRAPGRPRKSASTLGSRKFTAVKVTLTESEAEELKRIGWKSRTGNSRKLAGADIAAAFVRAAMQVCDRHLDLHGVEPGDDAELLARVRRAIVDAGT